MTDAKSSANVAKLSNQNYEPWKFKVELLLTKDDLWSTVEDDPPEEMTDSTEIEEPEETDVPPRRSGRANKGKAPERLIETMNKITTEQIERRNFKVALSSVHAEEWKKTMDQELRSLKKN